MTLKKKAKYHMILILQTLALQFYYFLIEKTDFRRIFIYNFYFYFYS